MEAYHEAYEAWHEARRPRPPKLRRLGTAESPSLPSSPAPSQPSRQRARQAHQAEETKQQAGGPTLIDWRGRTLQVIVKLANIVLTPDRPGYAGGVWHVEGMANERIVATAIYYYDSDNVGESRLSFRTVIDEPGYEQNDNAGIEAIYGLVNDQPLNQPLGSVHTVEGRCLAWPNLYQHRVEPFGLVDPKRPGHRKILVFFLIDPARPVVSTAQVLPQQRVWLVQALADDCVAALHRLSPPLQDLVVAYAAAGTMTLTEARGFRTELMAERKFAIDQVTQTVFERPFSLCEH